MYEVDKQKATIASGAPPTREDRIAGMLSEIVGDAPVFMVADDGQVFEIAGGIPPAIAPGVVSSFDDTIFAMFCIIGRQSRRPDWSVDWDVLPAAWAACVAKAHPSLRRQRPTQPHLVMLWADKLDWDAIRAEWGSFFED